MAQLHLLFLLTLVGLATAGRAVPKAMKATSAANLGPVRTNGRYYSKVCDPARFADLGLDMNDFSYCDSSLPYSARVKDLIGRMALGEKVLQLGDMAPGVDRIGLPNYNWWSEALHGVSNTGPGTHFSDIVPGAVVFPTVLMLASTFNASLWRTMGQVVSTEARAMYNLGHAGLTFWSPNLNVARDPRWGRTLETPGEDPYLVSVYGVNYVRGLQDVDGYEVVEDLNTRPLKISSCCKHYTAYDVDSWFNGMITRFTFDSRVTEQDMVETFNRPFEACVREGDASSIMCSFNRINGIPVCVDTRLMSQTFRNDWELHGYVVSDCDSLSVIHKDQKWLHDTAVDAVAQAIKAGLDLDCGYPSNQNYYQNYTEIAVRKGRVRETDIDNALKNTYNVLMRLGFFDGNQLYDSLGTKHICTKEHVGLAADAARQGIVLLKNDNLTLPLNKANHKKIALVGPHADAKDAMRGNYAGQPCRIVSPLDAFKADAEEVIFHAGCDVNCRSPDLGAVKEAAMKASATIIIAGLDTSSIEHEGKDRDTLGLPGRQVDLINQAVDASCGPVVLVIMSGSVVDVAFAEKNPKVGAIIWAGYPGEQGGQAIADVVFGRYNPGGRLAQTWYTADYVDALPMTSMQLRPVEMLGYPGRTYKFYDGPVQYPFGHGLSYTRFTYKLGSGPLPVSTTIPLASLQHCKPVTYKPKVTAPACPSILVVDSGCHETIDFIIHVINTGSLDGTDVVLVYTQAPATIDGAPIKQLVAFERVVVAANGHTLVKFSLNVCKALGVVEKTAYSVLPAGEHIISIGNNGLSFPYQVQFKQVVEN